MSTVYLGIGSNLGDRKKNIEDALLYLETEGIDVIRCSSIIETNAVGGPPQPKFLNAVAFCETDHSPQEFLKVLLTIEKNLGRERTVTNGPRTIDLDILLFDDLSISTPELTIPHPRMFKRDFVMTPLKEIAPELISLSKSK